MNHASRILCATAFLAFAGAAHADIYLGGGVYSASLDGAKNAALGAVDGNDVTPSLFVGWRPLELVGVEAGYYDFGAVSETVAGTNLSIEGHAFTVAGLVSLELGPVGAYVKGGLAQSSIDMTAGAANFSKTSSDPFGGIGASIDLMDKLYLYAEHIVFTNDAKIGAAVTGIGLRYTL